MLGSLHECTKCCQPLDGTSCAAGIGRAVQCGHLPTVKLLLERGATVDYRQPHGGNVFHVAAGMGRDDAGQMTLEYAAKSDLATLMALITMKDKRCVTT